MEETSDRAAVPLRLRPAGRVIVLDPQDRVLLFRYDDGPPNGRHWCTPGGGLNEGEDYPAGARRELAEETGWTDVPLGPEVHERTLVMEYDDVIVRQHERFFLARVEVAGRELGEVAAMHVSDGIAAWHWWTLAEMDATDEAIWPPGLAGPDPGPAGRLSFAAGMSGPAGVAPDMRRAPGPRPGFLAHPPHPHRRPAPSTGLGAGRGASLRGPETRPIRRPPPGDEAPSRPQCDIAVTLGTAMSHRGASAAAGATGTTSHASPVPTPQEPRPVAQPPKLQGRRLMPLMKLDSRRSGSPAVMSGTRVSSSRSITRISRRARWAPRQ